jgi:Flp pilus assembly protein TadD
MVTWAKEVSPVWRRGLIASARDSVSRRPHRAGDWHVLARLLIDDGRLEEAEQALCECAAQLPSNSKTWLLLADVRRRLGDADCAMVALDTALSHAPHDREAALRRFDLCVTLGRWEQVTPDLPEIAAKAPARGSVILAHAHLARANGDPQRLLSACDAALARQPGHTAALHHKAVALSMLGRSAEARAVIRFDDFVSVGGLPLGEDGADGATFLDAVAAEILRNPTLAPDPHGKATRHGLQTRTLVQAGDVAAPRLLDQIRSAVDRYVEALPDLSHPFATARPALVRLDAWAVVCQHDGHQRSHLHPNGWMSGVAYVTAPRPAGEASHPGPLVIGEVDAVTHPAPPPWGTREVAPVPGRIALFPSFVPHATRPTHHAEQRICVAFDVTPIQ